jgi:ubiquinone/menaquinone biosynthesis C-methylase UbiE
MNLRKIYNKLAKTYDLRHENPSTKRVREKERSLLKYVKGNALDVGCGTGYYLNTLRNCIGVDISEGMLKIAKRFGKVIQADSNRLPFKDETFETVLCMFSVLNMCNWKSTVEEMSRVLKRNGFCIISVASVYDNHYSFLEKLRISPSTEKHMRIYKQKMRLRLLRKNEVIDEFRKNGLILEKFDSTFIFQNPRWGDFTPLSLTEKIRLFLEKLLPFKDYGCMYFFVFKKI